MKLLTIRGITLLSFLSRLARGSFVVIALATGAATTNSVQGQDDQVAFRIGHAIEVNYQSTPGQVYSVESSSDNQDWVQVGDAYFGDGARVVELISYRKTGDRSKFFRVRMQDASEVGIGPVSLTGATYLLNDGGVLRTVRFNNGATGTIAVGDSEPVTFRYGFLKTGPKTGRLQMLFGDEGLESVAMKFETDSAGTFLCDRFQAGELAERDAGTFSRVYMGPKVIVNVDPETAAPDSPIGYSFVLFAGEQSNLIRVMNDIIVKESALNTSTSYTYDYSISGGIGQLTVWKGREKYDFYEFNFGSVGSGEFKRSQYAEGQLKDADVGVFQRDWCALSRQQHESVGCEWRLGSLPRRS